jgi:hypothetical protein
VRTRGKGDQGSMPLDQFVTQAQNIVTSKAMDL